MLLHLCWHVRMDHIRQSRRAQEQEGGDDPEVAARHACSNKARYIYIYYNIVLYYIILYYTILYYIICIVLYYIICIILYYIVSYHIISYYIILLESRRRRTKGSVVGEEWCQNVAPLRWYTKNFFAQSKMIFSRAWLHDTVSCAAWNDARKGVYLKPLFKTPCSNYYWSWSKPTMLDYRDISLMESVPLMWGPVTASPVGIEPMTIFGGGAPPLYLISNT